MLAGPIRDPPLGLIPVLVQKEEAGFAVPVSTDEEPSTTWTEVNEGVRVRGGWGGGRERASGSVGEGSEMDEGNYNKGGIMDESRPNGPIHSGVLAAVWTRLHKSEEGQAGDCKCRGVHRW